VEEKAEELITPTQFGFRRYHSTSLAISRFMNAVTAKGINYGLFIDFSKAFDSLDRNLLLEKLETEFKLPLYLVNSINKVMETNALYVSVGQDATKVMQQKGVIQGDSLSPYLFILFINSLARVLEEKVPSSTITLYADDISIVCCKRQDVQLCLDVLED